jgi:hypothetical protein
MSDDKSKSGGQDRLRINVHEDYELRDWSKRLRVTPERLKELVKEHGPIGANITCLRERPVSQWIEKNAQGALGGV